MVTLNSDLTFTGVIDPNEPTNHCSAELTDLARSVRDDQEVLESVRTLNDIFTEQKECLTHGDLHLGSVMVDGCTPKVMRPTQNRGQVVIPQDLQSQGCRFVGYKLISL